MDEINAASSGPTVLPLVMARQALRHLPHLAHLRHLGSRFPGGII
jgi:hypothetical protein